MKRAIALLLTIVMGALAASVFMPLTSSQALAQDETGGLLILLRGDDGAALAAGKQVTPCDADDGMDGSTLVTGLAPGSAVVVQLSGEDGCSYDASAITIATVVAGPPAEFTLTNARIVAAPIIDTGDDGAPDDQTPAADGGANGDGVDDLVDPTPPADAGGDGLDNLADPTPTGDDAGDEDEIDNLEDACRAVANPDQPAIDGDDLGNACDDETSAGTDPLLTASVSNEADATPVAFVGSASAPDVTISPTRGTVNLWVNYELEGFPVNATVAITWRRMSNSLIDIGTTTTDAFGQASGRFRVPATPSGPDQEIRFSAGSTSAVAFYELRPRIKAIPASGERGDEIDISLRGFGKQETVRIRWKDGNSWVELDRVVTSNTGSANVDVRVPSWAADGATSVRGDGTIYRAQTNAFTVGGGALPTPVEETPPPPAVTTTTYTLLAVIPRVYDRPDGVRIMMDATSMKHAVAVAKAMDSLIFDYSAGMGNVVVTVLVWDQPVATEYATYKGGTFIHPIRMQETVGGEAYDVVAV